MSKSKLSEGGFRRNYLARTKKMPCAKKKNGKGLSKRKSRLRKQSLKLNVRGGNKNRLPQNKK
jgi:ribosomal protein L9